MAKTPEKQGELSLENELGKKTEKPVESLVDSITGILTSVLKIKDLRGAQAALQEAQELKDAGKSDEARDLALRVFERLKAVGEDAEELPEKTEILALANRGEYGELTRLVAKKRKEIDAPGQIDKWKQVVDRTKFAEDELRKMDRKKKRLEGGDKTDDKVAEIVKLPKEAADAMRVRAMELAETEAELHGKVMENVEQLTGQLEGERGLKKKKELKTEYDNMLAELAMSGRSELSLGDVRATKEKLKELWREMSHKGDEIVQQVRERAKEGEKKAGGKEPWPVRMVRKLQSEKAAAAAVVARSKQLARVLGGLEEKLKLGLSFEQICRDLKPEEIGPILDWFESMKIKSGDKRYDPVLAELNRNLVEDPEGFRLFARLVENVKVVYEQQRYEEAAEGMRERGQRVPSREEGGYMDYEQPMQRDQFGRPVYGRPPEATDFDPRGAAFLRDRWNADWVNEWMREKTVEDRQRLMEMQRSDYREEMMNVNFDSLLEDVPELKDYLDIESFKAGKVARLKAEYRNDPKKKEEFARLWLQQMLYEQRIIAYEGVFQGAHQDARITRYNTLMSIMDIGTELKGLAKFHAQMFGAVDKQQNSFLNEDALHEMVAMWTTQGPDFRMEDMFKEYRENLYVLDADGKRMREPIGNISLYDVVHKLKMRVENPTERAALEMPEGVSRHYGTMMLRRTESEKRTADRKVIFFSLMKDIIGEEKLGGLDEGQQEWLYARYQSYLDFGVNYLWTHKQLHQAVGNASFEPNKYELPQALPEMLYKADFKLCMDYFRIYSVGGASKDAFVVGDSGMRDEKTMAPKDFANHLLNVETTTQGAPGILEAFFGGRAVNQNHAEWFGKAMEKAIFHNGYYDKNNPVSMAAKIGDESNMLSGTRYPDAETIDILRQMDPPAGFVEAIEWGTEEDPGVFAKIVKNPELVKKLTSTELTKRQKWDVFVGRYADDYYSTTAANAKRMDHFEKYGLKSHFQWYAAELAWQLTPINNTKALEAMQPAQAVNAGIVPALVGNFLTYTKWANEALGPRWLGGGKTERVKKDKDGKIKFTTDYGMLGQGNSEWPALDAEPLVNDSFFFNPIHKTSVNNASNVGSYQDELAIKNLAEDFQRAGMLPEDKFVEYVQEHVNKSFFWAEKQSPVINLWKLVTLESSFDYMGNVWFGIPGHMLRDAWGEATKEEVEKIWKYFSN